MVRFSCFTRTKHTESFYEKLEGLRGCFGRRCIRSAVRLRARAGRGSGWRRVWVWGSSGEDVGEGRMAHLLREFSKCVDASRFEVFLGMY